MPKENQQFGRREAMPITSNPLFKQEMPPMIIRRFSVDRGKTQTEMIRALGRKEHVEIEALATMPTNGPGEGELYFFLAKKNTSASDLSVEFERRNLEQDYFAQIQVNIDDPTFADEHFNGMYWEDDRGRFFYAAFCKDQDGREVLVGSDHGEWDDAPCWFAGRKKQ